MNAAEVVTALAADGVELSIRAGRLCVRPLGRARPELLALVRVHGQELRALLSKDNPAEDPEATRPAFDKRAANMEFDGGLPRDEAERSAGGIERQASWRGEGFDLGDLRPCLWCRNLARSGRCMAAWRGEFRTARDWQPASPNQPQRCVGYMPPDDDPDQRPGRERWPELAEWQARQATSETRGGAHG